MNKSSPPSFFTKLKQDLLAHNSVTFNLTDIPKSYRSQPYNLAAKLKDRANLDVSVVLNHTKIILFLETKTKPTPPTHYPSTSHHIC